MLAIKKQSSRFILYTLAAMTVVVGAVVFFIPPALFPDPSWGFQVMRSMQMGGGFNLLIGPDPADISKNMPTFLSWWSPGQYLVPYLVQTRTGLNLGHAVTVVAVLCNLSGLLGLYCFFKKIGFSGALSAWSLVFVVCQQAYWVPFAFYNGGEVLLFAFEGWFLYGCASFTKPSIFLILFVLVSGWAGFLCKSSFMWIFGSGLFCLWIRMTAGSQTLRSRIYKGLWLGLPAICSLAVIYTLYLSRGQNPASSSAGFKLTPEAFGFPLASPLLAGCSVDDLFNGLIFHTDGAPYSYATILMVLIPLVLLSIALTAMVLRQVHYNDYRLFLFVFYSFAFLFFSYSFLNQASISYEARHFRLIGLLVTPGLITLVRDSKRLYQLAFGLLCAAIVFQTARYLAFIPRSNRSGARGTTGISQLFIDQPSLNYLTALDRTTNQDVFAFTSPDIGLEIRHNRIITLNPPDGDPKENPEPYRGHAGPLYLLVPSGYNTGQIRALFNYFPGYSHFTGIHRTKNFMIYTAP
jgi:hypothetical protein